MAVSTGSIYFYDTHFASKIVVFDSSKYINSLRQQYIKKEINKKEPDQRVDKLGVFLKSQPRNVVILPKDIVIGTNVKTIKIN